MVIRELVIDGLTLMRTFCDASVSQAGITMELCSDDLLVVDGPGSISYRGDPSPPPELLELRYSGFPMQITRIRPLVPTPLDPSEPLVVLLLCLWPAVQQVQQHHLSRDLAGQQLMDLVLEIMTRLLCGAVTRPMSQYSSATLARAKTEINANYADPQFNVTALASKMKISARRLLSLFNEHGTTTLACIQERRLRHARNLLSDPDNAFLKVAVIAQMSGFNDHPNFCRTFRRMFGLTPRQYRDGCL